MSEPITLPDFPEETEFEEFIAAYYQCQGFYVERNVIMREVEEILELDIIYTSYDATIPQINIVEIKSGNWGFYDLFKVKGWLVFIGEDRASFVVKKRKKSHDFHEQKASELNIDLITLSTKEEAISYYSKDHQIDDIDLFHWRCSYLIERNLIKYLKHLKKSDRGKISYEMLDTYYHNIKGGIFFTKNTLERLDRLYELFKEHPNVSSSTAQEINGSKFFDEGEIPEQIFKDTFYSCKKNPIQISTFIEYLARLTILKNAVDFQIYQDNGESDHADKVLFQIGDQQFSMLDALPASIKYGIKELSSHPYFYRYPIFWQWFIYVFGGFILLDYKEEDYKTLSKKTGIPVEQIDNALDVFDILFPTANGWYTTPSNSNVKLLKTFPMPFRGIGANYRRLRYLEGADKAYKHLKLTNEYTLTDLRRWNRLGYDILKIT